MRIIRFQVSFWRAPAHAVISEFYIFLLQLKSLEFWEKSVWDFFSIYLSFLRYLNFKQNCTSFFVHVKINYWIQLMAEKEFLNFLIWFYIHLWLLQVYIYPALKKSNYWILSSPNFKLGKLLTAFLGETS